jgi:DNA polymerase V
MQKASKIVSSTTIDFYSVNTSTALKIPMVEGGIAAGFPSPAQDYIDLKIDLNKELIANPSSTFYGRVKGASMKDAGIEDGDILVIDKSLEPRDGDTAVCFIDGEFTLKYIKMETDAVYLIPANSNFKPIKVTEDNNFCIWGVVTYSIKSHKNPRSKKGI